jgi:hypothetical protein
MIFLVHYICLMEISFIDTLVRLFNSLLNTTFLGFALLSLLYLCISKIKKWNNTFNSLYDSATYLIRFAGITFLLLLILTFIPSPTQSNNAYEKYSILNRMFGPYWFVFWIQISSFGFLSQLFWINRIKKSGLYIAVYSIIILFMLFLLNYELFVIIMVSINRDYIPNGWADIFSPWQILLSFIMKIFTFSLLLGLTHLIKVKIKTHD